MRERGSYDLPVVVEVKRAAPWSFLYAACFFGLIYAGFKTTFASLDRIEAAIRETACETKP